MSGEEFTKAVTQLLNTEVQLAIHARTIAQTGEWKKHGYTSATNYLVNGLGAPLRVARKALRDAQLLFRVANNTNRTAIIEGERTLEHARLLYDHFGPEAFNTQFTNTAEFTDAQLRAHVAANKPAERPVRQRCRYSLSGNVMKLTATLVGTDAVKAHAALHALVRAQYNTENEKRGQDRRNADALASMLIGTDGAHATPLLGVIVDADPTTASSWRTTTGATLSAEEATTLLGDTAAAWVVFRDPVSLQPLLFGRTRRLASVQQRLALMAMQTECAIDGCSVPIHKCQIHHKHEWKDGGPTDIDNLIGVCARHHALLTAGHITL